ncbi:MAG: haloacid dehalogenase-like hydrolase [Myxococcales bacterium]|nr:haloacid dehalogenase-like hydrolase [Myxococcales bacterium]
MVVIIDESRLSDLRSNPRSPSVFAKSGLDGRRIVLGIDFDNTLARYDELFHSLAIERGLIHPGTPATKLAVRSALREQGRDREWTELQGLAYGERLLHAPPFEFAIEALRALHQRGCELRIVSHKTRFPARGPRFDLRQSALDWLRIHRIMDLEATGIGRAQVFFENSQRDKRARIQSLGCTHFIDDLREFLLHPEFPTGVQRFLFDPNSLDKLHESIPVITHWDQVRECLSRTRKFVDHDALPYRSI